MTMIYGGTKGWQPVNTQPLRDPSTGTVTDYGQKLGYQSDPTLYGGGALGGENQNFYAPNQSKTGQPVPASFDTMSIGQKEQFATQGGRQGNAQIPATGPLVPTQEQYFAGGVYYPVYTQANAPDYSGTLGQPVSYDYIPYNAGSTPGFVKVPKYNAQMPNTEAIAATDRDNLIKAIQNTDPNFNYYGIGFGNKAMSQAVASGNKQAMLAALYDVDPKAAMLVSAQMAQQSQQGQGGAGGGMWGGPRNDRNIENEAIRRRNYDIQSRNYARAGLPSPTLLDIPRQEWDPANGPAPWGSGEAPYQRYGRQVQNGYALPFDYEVGSPFYNRGNVGMGGRGGTWGGQRPGMGGGRSGGGWSGGDARTPEPGGGRPEGGWGGRPANPNMGPWFNQLPWWARGARQYGPALGSGLMGG